MDYAFEEKRNIVDELSETAKQELIATISNNWEWSTREIQELIDDHNEAWDFYLKSEPKESDRAVKKGDKRDSKDAFDRLERGIRLGLIPRSVDAVLAILHNSLFPPDERFYRGTPGNAIAKDNQELFEVFLAQNFGESNISEKFRRGLLALCIDPAVAFCFHYKTKKCRKVTYVPKYEVKIGGFSLPLPLGLKKKTDDNYVEWEGTDVEVLDFTDWRVDPYARSQDESWFMRRWYRPVSEVEEDFGLEEIGSYSQASAQGEEENLVRDHMGLRPIDVADEPDGNDKALLMVCYDDFEIDGKTYKNHCALVVNAKELAWFGPIEDDHGKCPYVIHALKPVPNQIYGLPLIRHAINLAGMHDYLLSKVAKTAGWAGDPIFEVDAMEPAYKKRFAIRPGMTIPVRRVGSAIKQVDVNVANLSYIQPILVALQDSIREVTGANPMFTGDDVANSPANITAFQVDQHIQGANNQFQAILKNFSSVLETYLSIAFSNFRQYKQKTEYIPIGSDQKELTPDMVKQMDYKWTITSAEAANARGKQLANLRTWNLELLPMLVSQGLVQLKGGVMVADPAASLKDMLNIGGMDASKYLEVVEMQPGVMPLGQPPIPIPGGVVPPGQGGPVIPQQSPGVQASPGNGY